MNRHQRRASEAQARKAPAPTQSFTDLVSEASLNRLKPFIMDTVQVMGSNLARQQLSSQANILTRLSVLEDLVKEKLGETDESLTNRLADREDAALQLQKTDEPAKQGDTVRITFKAYEEGKEEQAEATKAVLRHLNVEPIQFTPELEAGLIGAKAGETRIIKVDTGSTTDATTGESRKNPDVIFNVLVDRVSIKIATNPEANSDANTQA